MQIKTNKSAPRYVLQLTFIHQRQSIVICDSVIHLQASYYRSQSFVSTHFKHHYYSRNKTINVRLHAGLLSHSVLFTYLLKWQVVATIITLPNGYLALMGAEVTSGSLSPSGLTATTRKSYS